MSTIFKDEKLLENGRSRKLDDCDFAELVELYEKVNPKLSEYLKNNLFKDINSDLFSDHNKQVLDNILNDIRWEECISFIEKEIERYSNIRLADLKGGEEHILEVYKSLLEYARKETYEWMIQQMYWWVTEYKSRFYGVSDICFYRVKISKLLFSRFDLGNLLKDEYKKKFESVNL